MALDRRRGGAAGGLPERQVAQQREAGAGDLDVAQGARPVDLRLLERSRESDSSIWLEIPSRKRIWAIS